MCRHFMTAASKASTCQIPMSRSTRWSHAGPALAVALLVLISASVPGRADSPVKDLLGRAQQGLDARAVEDLIGKLEGKPKGQPPTAAPAPAAAPPSTVPQPPAKAPSAAAPPNLPARAGQATPPPAPAAASAPASPTPPPAPPALALPTAVPAIPPPPAAVVASPPAAAPPAAVAPPPAAAAPPPTPAAAQPLPAPATPAKTAKPSAPTPPAKPAAASDTDAAVAAADRQQLPSVDLDIPFAFDSAEVGADAVPVLSLLGKALSDPRLSSATFIIAGHTDGKGRADYNMRLSQQRADAVRVYLVKTHGIDMRRLTAQGYGATRPKDPRNPKVDANRRVQIVNVSAQPSR